ncbi:AAA family ATPase [Phaeobacter marinintestinus]|uniref:AAA family ATPase n=1 Tax=Falsiphaeobacter marinintestinus TaxID=1492905 RepID=UPI001644A61B|nr:AAA family ATPase [Phaeobacter marinintestinus]
MLPWAQAFVDASSTYCETSPSGTGIRMIFTSADPDLPTHGHERHGIGFYGANVKKFVTMTGRKLPDCPDVAGPMPQDFSALVFRSWRIEGEKVHRGESTPDDYPHAEEGIAAALEDIATGAAFHPAILAVATRAAGLRMPREDVEFLLLDAMEKSSQRDTARWHERYPESIFSVCDWIEHKGDGFAPVIPTQQRQGAKKVVEASKQPVLIETTPTSLATYLEAQHPCVFDHSGLDAEDELAAMRILGRFHYAGFNHRPDCSLDLAEYEAVVDLIGGPLAQRHEEIDDARIEICIGADLPVPGRLQDTDYYRLFLEGGGESIARTVSGADVFAYDPGPVDWVVDDMISPGLTLFVGQMKTGKSFLMMQLMEAVTTGAQLFGHDTKRCRVLYYAVEDGKARIARRARGLQETGKFNPDLDLLQFSFEGGADSDELVAMLRADMQAFPDVGLILIDTFKMATGARKKSDANAYEADVEMLTPFKRLAEEFGVAIVGTFHERKPKAGSKHTGDPYNAISGSAGLAATADNMLRLTRERESVAADLYISGRDVRTDRSIKIQQSALEGGMFQEMHVVAAAAVDRRASMREGAGRDIQKILSEAEDFKMSRADLKEELRTVYGKSAEAIKKAILRSLEDGFIVTAGAGHYALPEAK